MTLRDRYNIQSLCCIFTTTLRVVRRSELPPGNVGDKLGGSVLVFYSGPGLVSSIAFGSPMSCPGSHPPIFAPKKKYSGGTGCCSFGPSLRISKMTSYEHTRYPSCQHSRDIVFGLSKVQTDTSIPVGFLNFRENSFPNHRHHARINSLDFWNKVFPDVVAKGERRIGI